MLSPHNKTIYDRILNICGVDTMKPIEHLIGPNYHQTRWRLGNIHCFTSYTDAIRELSVGLSTIPAELRRGFIYCIVDTLNEYRQTYCDVMLRRDYNPNLTLLTLPKPDDTVSHCSI